MTPLTHDRANGLARPCWAFVVTALLGASVATAQAGAQGAEEQSERMGTTRTALEEYVDTQRIISKEKQDWALGKELLSDRIDAVQREIEQLRSRIDDAVKTIAESDKKRAELFEENEKLKTAASALEVILRSLEDRTRKLVARLPDPLRERIKPLSQKIPAADDKDTKLSLGERFSFVVGLLNDVNKFNREITVTSEVRDLGNGTTAEVATLYVGIGQGYYVTTKGDAAGIGTATASGWVWSEANDSADKIAEAIAILKNEKPAAFVQLPLVLKTEVPSAEK